MYYIIFILALIGAIVEICTKKKIPSLFNVIFFLLFMMSIFRYGQGQDYFNYEYLYGWVGTITDKSFGGILLFPDIGYGILNYICLKLGMSYEMFMGLFTALSMTMFYVFLKRTCECSMVALFVFYSVIFMIYPISASRQGFCMAFFLCLMYPLLEQKKYKKYYSLLLFIITFHASSIIVGIFPLLFCFKIPNRILFVLFCLSFILMFLKVNIFTFLPIPFLQARMSNYLESSGNQILAKIVRFILVFPLLYLPYTILLKNKEIENNRMLLIIGFVVYAFTSFSELASSRLWGYFLGFECILFSKLSTKLHSFKNKKLFLIYYVLIVSVLWIKDINGAMEQGGYRNCSILSYPYISIFEEKETLDMYRTNKGYVNE